MAAGPKEVSEPSFQVPEGRVKVGALRLADGEGQALVTEGGDKDLPLRRFWQLCVILSMQGKARKSQRGHAATGKDCLLFQALPVLFFLSILTSHFRETKMMEADKKLFELRLILSSPYRGIQEALHSLVSLFEVLTYHPPPIKI